MRIAIMAYLFFMFSLPVAADTPPPGTVNAKIQDSAGNALTSTSGSLNVNVIGGGGGGTVNQGNAGSQSWLVDVTNTVPVSGTLTCNVGTGTQPVSGTVAISNFPSTQTVTGTFWQTTQPVSGTLTCNAGTGTQSVSVTNFPATQPISSTQLPASLGAKTTANSISVNIASDQTVPISGSITVTNTANGNPGSATPTQATQIGGSDGTNLRALSVSTGGVLNIAASALPLPTGAATNAELIVINSTLGSPFQSGGSIGNSSFGISGTLPSFASTPTFNLGTLNGAATSALQSSTITTLGSPFQSGGSIGNTSFAATQSTAANLNATVVGAGIAGTPSGGVVSVQGVSGGTAIPVSGTITVSSTTANQGTANTSANGWPVKLTDGTSVAGVTAASTAATATQPAGVVAISPNSPLPTGTNNIGSITNVTGTVSLPTGAATAAGLTTINSTLGSPFQAGGSIGNTSFTATQATGTNLHTVVDSGTVTATISGTPNVAVTSSALPTGAATATGVAAIVTALGSPIQTTGGVVAATQSGNWNLQYNPVNANATLSARQTVTGTETNVAAPTNAVGVIVECESVNADNLRWGFSSSTSAILSSTLGLLCEPGRDSGYLPLGIGTYLHLISTGSGSDFADVQWVTTH